MGSQERVSTVVIGGGQAGLAVGYHLKQRGKDFQILDASSRVGDSWRSRWDSLELFTPARYNSLPGMRFPGSGSHFPNKDEVASYLDAYAERFALPIQSGVKVERVTSDGKRYTVTANSTTYEAENVVVATGAFHRPRIPEFASQLAPSVMQLHSSQYKNPGQLKEGDVLVVGAGNSGAQIALDLVKSRKVYLSGRETGALPRKIIGIDIYRFIWPTVLAKTIETKMGQKFQAKAAKGGDPLVGFNLASVQAAGVEHVGRTTGVRDGMPVVEGDRALKVANVIWATGFVPDFSFISRPVFQDDGYPRHHRGVAKDEPGLYFIGLRFLWRIKSHLTGGVGDDAGYIADTIAKKK
jgi:putative flavoprotein involved in K+ transport